MTVRPGITFLLMLLAALAMLAGGVLLARRTVEDRIPADRTLLRETASTLQGEAVRLEAVFTGHLRDLGSRVLAGEEDAALRQALAGIRGVRGVSLLTRDGKDQRHLRLPGPQSVPEPVLTGDEPPRFASQFAVPLVTVFDDSTEAARKTFDGWLAAPPQGWLVWWRRFDPTRAAVFLIRADTVRAVVGENMDALLDSAWAPVRAAGEAARISDSRGTVLRSAGAPTAAQSDFILPLTCRLGAWHLEAWDRRAQRLVYDQTTLIVSGALAAGIAALGWVVAAQQRRALREARAQVSFVNRASHELGAPLTNLRLSLELAREALPAEAIAAGESARRLDIALEETARLSRLAENVLTHARGESGRLTVASVPCTPAATVRGVLEQFAPALERRGIRVEEALDDSLLTLTDPDALAQITANLVSNVEKYAASGSWMGITLAAEGDRWTLRIADRGPGIPAADRERIFRPFERLDSRITEGVSGTGLGLSICRELARRLSGDVVLAASAQGAEFVLTLPLTAPRTLPQPHSSAGTAPASGPEPSAHPV